MKKQIKLPLVIAIAFIVAAIAFSAAYMIATGVMNAKLTDLGEKQSLFSTLSDVDSYVREKYHGKIDEERLTEELCRGYAKVFGGDVLYLNADEYKDSGYTVEAGYTVLELADGSAVVVLSDGQTAENTTETTSEFEPATTAQ